MARIREHTDDYCAAYKIALRMNYNGDACGYSMIVVVGSVCKEK